MGFHRQEFWSGLPFPSPGDLLSPRIEPRSPALQADSLASKIEWKLDKHSHIDISKRINFQILNFQTHAQLKILQIVFPRLSSLSSFFTDTPQHSFHACSASAAVPRWQSSGVHHKIISKHQCGCLEWMLT